MDKLNRILTFVVGAIVAVAMLASSGRQPEPSNDPWFKQAVLENTRPVVVKFGAEWCGPCQGMDEAIDSLSPQYSSRAKFLKIDVDQKPDLFAHYRSGNGIPQVMIFKEGKIVAQQRGFGGTDGLQSWLEESL